MGRGDRRRNLRAGGAFLALLIALYGFGAWRLSPMMPVSPRSRPASRCAWSRAISTRSAKLTGAHRDRDIAQHLRLSATTPGFDQRECRDLARDRGDRVPGSQRRLAGLCRGGGAAGRPVITGTLRGDPPQGEPERYWNSLAVIDPQARIVATRRQVPSGAAGRICAAARHSSAAFVGNLTAGAGDFSAGPGPVTVRVPGLPPFSPLICYEVIFPGAVADRQ